MKRILLLVLIFMMFGTTCLASSSIVINDVTKKEVADTIVELFLTQHQNIIVESTSDYGVTFLFTRTETSGLFNQFVFTYENRLNFSFIQQENNILVSTSETCTSTDEYGRRITRPVGTAVTELPMLQKLKGYFNGIYLFGFSINSKIKNGGIEVIEIIPNSPMDKSGVKNGDIITMVNGEKVKSQKEKYLNGAYIDSTREQILNLTIKRGKEEIKTTVTSEYNPPKYNKK